ncbi:tRNA pseudouridine(13) synthase TruD [Desulfurobacterium sp.]
MAKIKLKPEDFRVKEILKPGFLEGRGYRVYSLWKRGLETEEAIRRVARISGVARRFVSHGGLKDKNAVTVQFISVPEKFKLEEIADENLKVFFTGFSGREISPFLVEGNFFEIYVRESFRYPERISILKEFGIPGYYGEQRFTPVRGNNFFVYHFVRNNFKNALFYLFTPAGWENSRNRKGKKLFVAGNFGKAACFFSGWRKKVALFLEKSNDFRKALSIVPESEIKFQFNVFQSYLFNRYLGELIGKEAGEKLIFKYKLGEMVFPMKKVVLPEEVPIFYPGDGRFYLRFLKEMGLSLEELLKFSKFFHRFNRETVVFVKNFEIKETVDGVILRFFLPSGHYATNVVRFLFDAVRKK